MLKLIDLSNNNPSPIDFHAIRRAGIYGVWLKVSEGLTFVDPDWQARALDAHKAGLRVGGYHFARPGEGNGVSQAEFFCRHLGPVGRRDLHPVLDLEDGASLSPAALHEWARTFLAHVHTVTGARGITYSGAAFIADRRWSITFGSGAGLWLADYGPDDGTDHGAKAPRPWRKIVAHQYTSKGTVHGVNGHVDLSHARARRKVLAHGIRGIA